MPSSRRPPERMSTVLAMLASTAGLRWWMPVTSVPMRSRVVACASAPSIVHASRHGPSGSAGRCAEAMGRKWSNSHAESKRSMASASRQTARISGHELYWLAVLTPKRTATSWRTGGDRPAPASVGDAEPPAAVDHDLLAGDVLRGRRGEEEREGLDVVRPADPVHGHVLRHQLLHRRVVGMAAADV